MENVEEIFDFKEKEKNSLTVMSTDDGSDEMEETRYSARRVTEVELEEENGNRNARREIDKLILINALSEMNGTIGAMYERIEKRMVEISSEVATSLMRSGYDIVDGPRRDSVRRVCEILEPSSLHVVSHCPTT